MNRSEIVEKKQEEVISIISFKIIYDGKLEKRDRGITGFCQLRFHDSDFNSIRFRNEKVAFFHLLKSERGKITMDELRCMHHIIPLIYLKHRRTYLTDWAFWAHPGFINYAGHVTVTYKSGGFKMPDLFGLGGSKEDEGAKVEVVVEDKIEEAITFLNNNYPELRDIPVTKSILMDAAKIKPDKKAEVYVPEHMRPVVQMIPHPMPIPMQPHYSPNPYYTSHPKSQTTPYYNPYDHQGAVTPVE